MSPQHRQGRPFVDAAIVIVNYRAPELVERCMESVYADSRDLSLEAVIVDNDSQDGSVARLRSALPDATVIAMPNNGGFAVGVNEGFRHCDAELVIVLNPDTELRHGTLHALLTGMRERPEIGVLAPLLEGEDGRITPNGYRRFPGLATVGMDICVPIGYALTYAPALHPYAMSPAALIGGRTPRWVCGAAMAIRRAAYLDAGPLDEGFFLYFEDTEWQRRVHACGWEIELLPAARARHLIRSGGERSLSPSPYFITSAVRYLRAQGVPHAVSRAVLALSLACSYVTLCTIAALPSKRQRASVQARAYRALLTGMLRRTPPGTD